MKKPFVCILTGPPAAGKSTISKKLACDISNSAYVDVDYIREMIKSGYVNPFPMNKEVRKQILLSMKNACDVAKNFLKKGFNVFIDDVLEDELQINYYNKNFKGNKLFIFLLLPKKAILKKRDLARGEDAMGERAIELHSIFEKKSSKNWYVIDNSKETYEQTSKKIRDMIIKK